MLQFRSINCNFLHFLAITCNSVQLLAILCNNLQFRAIAFNFLQYLAEYCATSCNLVITCNYILLFASSRSWILLNLVSHKSKVDGLKKFLKSKYCRFFDLMHFRPCQVPSGGFLKKEACQFQFHLTTVK